MATQLVWRRGFQNVIFEGDNQMVTRLINGVENNFGLHNWITDIRYWQSKFVNIEVVWVLRQSHQATDRLTKEITHSAFSFLYSFIPMFLVFLYRYYIGIIFLLINESSLSEKKKKQIQPLKKRELSNVCF